MKQSRAKSKAMFIRFKNAFWSLRTVVCAVGILVMLGMFTAAIIPVRYDISVGMVPTHTITANRDVVDEITTEKLRKDAAAAVQPTYHYSEGVADQVLKNFDAIWTQMDESIQYSETLEDYGPDRRYSADELAYARTILTSLELRDYQLRTLLNTTREDLDSLYSILSAAVQNTLNGNIIEGAESQAIDSILKIVGYRIDTSLLQNVVQPLLRSVIQPNMIIDQETTAADRQQARDSVEPIVYKQGQNIVVKGEGRVERYQYDMLANLGLLSSAELDISIYLGGALMVVLVMAFALILVRLTDKRIARDYKWLMLLLTITALTLGACILARMINIYLAPLALGALLISAMIGIRPAIIINGALALLVSALAAGGSTEYTVEMVHVLACSLCSGSLVAIMLSKHSNRLSIIGTSFAAAACNFLVMLAISLMTSSSNTIITSDVLWSMSGPMLSGLLCFAVQPLLEAIFNLPTQNKLMELSNPNHPLLRRLLLEAPGTYHHSIVVANLAEAAAEAIGANPLLARVGGYYHDVGKLRRPLYFKENQLGESNKLDEVDPYTAAQIVISHTKDGITLARNYHLPREILKIIAEHHGNTPVMYFYSQAVKNANGQIVDAADFRYDANPPSTKEGAIVLLCDTIEAAVRSMQNPTPAAIEEFIVKLIRGKLQDGQLSNSPLTLKDIDEICHASATVLNGVFHERIEYPDPPPAAKLDNVETPETPAPAPVVNEDLTKPWDGITEEETPKAEKPAPAAVAVPVAAAVEAIESKAEETLEAPKQIQVDPSQFEAARPLPLVELPTTETILSVEEALVRVDEQIAVEDGQAAAENDEEPLPDDFDPNDYPDDEDIASENLDAEAESDDGGESVLVTVENADDTPAENETASSDADDTKEAKETEEDKE